MWCVKHSNRSMCSYIIPTVETLLSTLGEGVCSVSTSVDVV